MIQSTAAAHALPSSELLKQCQNEWSEHYGLARFLARRKLVCIDGSVPHDIDDQISEAIAHAWRHYPKLRQRKPDVPAKRAIRWACRFGVSRVWARQRFVPKPYPSYVDALDRKADREPIDELIGKPVGPIRYSDPTDRTNVEAMIETLPPHLQPVARLLSYGMPKRTAAKRRGISPSTLYQYVREIRELLS